MHLEPDENLWARAAHSEEQVAFCLFGPFSPFGPFGPLGPNKDAQGGDSVDVAAKKVSSH